MKPIHEYLRINYPFPILNLLLKTHKLLNLGHLCDIKHPSLYKLAISLKLMIHFYTNSSGKLASKSANKEKDLCTPLIPNFQIGIKCKNSQPETRNPKRDTRYAKPDIRHSVLECKAEKETEKQNIKKKHSTMFLPVAMIGEHWPAGGGRGRKIMGDMSTRWQA